MLYLILLRYVGNVGYVRNVTEYDSIVQNKQITCSRNIQILIPIGGVLFLLLSVFKKACKEAYG